MVGWEAIESRSASTYFVTAKVVYPPYFLYDFEMILRYMVTRLTGVACNSEFFPYIIYSFNIKYFQAEIS